jgi:hypothetical protein
LFWIPQSDSISTNGCEIRYGDQIITPTKGAIDVQNDAEDDGMRINYAGDAGQNVIDSINLKAEGTRVAPSLQIPAATNDWWTHFSQTTQDQTTILDCVFEVRIMT